MDNARLDVDGVTQQFWAQGECVTVLDAVSVSFMQGATYALVGTSGSGKSTLLHLLAGLEQPTDGKILYNGKDIAFFGDREQQHYLQQVIGLLFQSPNLIDELSVVENVMLKGLIAGLPAVTNKERAHALLALVGLEHKITTMPAALSGGEKQRVALARALFIPPQFLLADEPTAHLDKVTQEAIMNLIMTVQKESGMGLIIASHDDTVVSLMDHRLPLSSTGSSVELV